MRSIAVHRLHSQRLVNSAFQTPADVVAWMGAMQGQDYTGAKLSVGLRLPGSTDADIEQAISDKLVLRTWLMRGTLHLVAAADIRWMVALLAEQTIGSRALRYRELELEQSTLLRANELLADALRDGKQLTRPELFAILQANGISTAGQRGVHMLQRASMDGLICQTVVTRNQPTFMAMDSRVPEFRPLAREEALAALARRYFTSRSPASLQDFIAWSGLTAADARTGLEAVKEQLVEEKIEGKSYWVCSAGQPREFNPPKLLMLPGFDEFLLGYRDRSAALDPQYFQRIVPGGNGVFFPTIVVEGRVAGTWKRTLKKNSVVVEVFPFTALSSAETDAFAAAAASYGDFLELPVVLV